MRSSSPTGGEGTHSVFSSHRGLPSKTLFTDLDQIQEGDLFFLDILGRRDGIQGGGDFDSRAGRDRSPGNYSGKRLCNPCNMYSVWNQFSPPSCKRGKDSPGRRKKKQKEKITHGIWQWMKILFVVSAVVILAAGILLIVIPL